MFRVFICILRACVLVYAMQFALIPHLDNYSSYKPTVEFRSANMGNGAYPLMLRAQLCRQMVRWARETDADLTWTEPAELTLQQGAALQKHGHPPWGVAVRNVTTQQMDAFVESLHFEPSMRALLLEYIRTLDTDPQ